MAPRKPHRLLLVILLALAVVWPVGGAGRAAAEPPERAVLYFFWAEGCPHCAAAKPVLALFQQRYPQLEVRSFEVGSNADNQRRLSSMAAKFGIEPTGVPIFFLGSQHWVGFSRSITPRVLEAAISRCVSVGCPDAGADVADGETAKLPRAVVELPFVGQLDPDRQSLVLSTVLIAAVDGVNPCSLWVLSILLALTLRTGSRRTTAVTGLVFIAVTGVVYALFIGGLFSVFQVLSFTPVVRVVVAVLAAAFAAINIKDFFWFKAGVSLSIPEASKPGIYDRMRRVLGSAQSLPALVASTVVLAAGVSFVELACTAGFPVLWTSIVTDRGVSAVTFSLLLGLYMLVYQLDELIIFAVAVATMRITKLQERQGRLLKLLSGMLMLSLAVVMLIKPALLNDVRTSVVVFAAAGGAAALILLVERRFRSTQKADGETKARR
jgi:thiol-disulfide isomerase/thioredoxin